LDQKEGGTGTGFVHLLGVEARSSFVHLGVETRSSFAHFLGVFRL
jgi:hypothetical protein